MDLKRLTKTDRRILLVALLLLFITSAFMWDDRFILPKLNTPLGPKIAELSSRNNDVRKKVSNQFFWQDARSSDDIHLGDSLFTGQESSALITLNQGAQFEVGENSLVVFSSDGDQLDLDLRFGQVLGNLSGSSSLQLKVRGQDINISGTDAKIELSADGKLNVLKGKVKVTPENALTVTQSNIQKNISWSPTPSEIHYHFKKNPPLRLAWAFKGNYGRFRVDTSETREFKKILSSDYSLKPVYRTRNYPSSGTLFYRITALNLLEDEIAQSTVIPVKFQTIETPQITEPLPNSRLSLRTDADGEYLDPNRVQVKWTYTRINSTYELQLGKDKNFKDVIFEQKLNLNSLQTPALPMGEYFVRVRDAAPLDGNFRPWSEAVSFTLDATDPLKLAAPVIINPKRTLLVPTDKNPVLSWTKVPGAEQYVVEISNDADFVGQKQIITATSNQLEYKDYYPANLHYRVFASTQKGTLGTPSEPGILSVKARRPILYPTEKKVILGKSPEDPGDPQDFEVKWEGNNFAKKYVVEVAKDPKFRKKQRYIASVNNGKVTVPEPGEYFWRVKPLDERSRSLSTFSEIGNLSYILKVPLATPQLLEPANNVTLYFQKSLEPFFWLEWASVRQALKYRVEISLDPEFKTKILTKELGSPRILLKDSLPQGQLYWRVMALGEDGKISNWSEARKMSVYSGRRARGFSD